MNTKTSFGIWLRVAAKKVDLNIVKFLVHKDIDISIRYTRESLHNTNAHEHPIEFWKTEIAEYLMR
ncbi:hypothetical protein MHB52_35340 [Bacillus sp. FSL K6-0073]|uniref:hypothetical protein n=1 Tax=Bacillus sp. FSL K6-0073 TaxID=2921414 RepID=UPI0020A3426F|nr:hypothetical protein [Bacillus cereus]